MEMKECKHYPNCEAPICPLELSTRDISLWYKTEQICRNSSFSKERWRINQFRISHNKRISDDNYFTMELLNNIQTISNKIIGINPDSFTTQMAEKQLRRASSQKRRT